MTVPPRGVRSRRSGRRPGWLLLTALLVLAILASSTLVFTSRVELLRLAVILSMWAAVIAAFVSVIYRRQSQLDEARARDMKLIYNLQLDREISARREYELAVEAHLRRQLGHEVRAQAADEMAALRSELMSLRAHLEALLGTDLGVRTALESDRVADALSMPPAPDRVASSRVTEVVTEVTEVVTEEITGRIEAIADESEEDTRAATAEVAAEHPGRDGAAEAPIIDVPEEPLPPRAAETHPVVDHRTEPRLTPWRPAETETRRGRHWTPDGVGAPTRGRHWSPEAPAPERSPDSEDAGTPGGEGQHTGGHSVADLMARLRVDGGGGEGGRRRRKD